MTQVFASLPLTDPIGRPPRERYIKTRESDPLTGMLTNPWIEYFSGQAVNDANRPIRINSISLTGQAASIGATDISTGLISAGMYHVTAYFRITQAATVSSSLDVTYAWTESGVAVQTTSPSLVTNTITSIASYPFDFIADASSPITFATTYASVGGTPMQYRIDVALTRVNA